MFLSSPFLLILIKWFPIKRKRILIKCQNEWILAKLLIKVEMLMAEMEWIWRFKMLKLLILNNGLLNVHQRNAQTKKSFWWCNCNWKTIIDFPALGCFELIKFVLVLILFDHRFCCWLIKLKGDQYFWLHWMLLMALRTTNDVMIIYGAVLIVMWSRWMKVMKNWKNKNLNDGEKNSLHFLFLMILMEFEVITYGIQNNPM